MQMSIMQEKADVDLVGRVDEFMQWTTDADRLREESHICDILVIDAYDYEKSSPVQPIVEYLIECIDKYFPKFHAEHHAAERSWPTAIVDIPIYDDQFSMFAFDFDKPAAFSFEAMPVLSDSKNMRHSYISNYRNNSAHFNWEFLISKMCAFVHQPNDRLTCLGGSIQHLQKEGTFKTALFIPEETSSLHSSYPNVFTAFASDSRLIWANFFTFFCFWVQQLYRKAERLFLAKKRFEHLSELHETAKSHQYHVSNRHLRCRRFLYEFTLLTYSFKLLRMFCILSHHTPEMEIFSPSNPEQRLSFIDDQENYIVDISMVIFAEFVRMLLVLNCGNVSLTKRSRLPLIQGQPPAVRAAIGAAGKTMRSAAFVLGQDGKTKTHTAFIRQMPKNHI